MKNLALSVAAISLVASCGSLTEIVTKDSPPRILAVGDSMFAWHRVSGRAVSNFVSSDLGEPVQDNSFSGAKFGEPLGVGFWLNISNQYHSGNWEWVIVNGGGNDLWMDCGCRECDDVIERLAARDGGHGYIVDLLQRIRKDGAKVIYVGYFHNPGSTSLIDQCKDENLELEGRIERFAGRDPGTFYLPLHDVVPHGDLSYHWADRIHPSVKGSQTIGRLISEIISQN